MRKILIPLIAVLMIGVFGIITSKNLPKQAGFFVFSISTGITGFILSIMLFLLLFQLVKKEKVTKIEELENALYECECVYEEIGKVWRKGKPTGEIYNESWEIARKIVPNLQRLRKYSDFIRENPELGRAIFYVLKLWEHYHGGKRVKTKGPYKEMGEDLIFLNDELYNVLKKYGRLSI